MMQNVSGGSSSVGKVSSAVITTHRNEKGPPFGEPFSFYMVRHLNYYPVALYVQRNAELFIGSLPASGQSNPCNSKLTLSVDYL